MAYIVKYDKRALKSILKLDKKSRKQIKTYIKEIIEKLENPRSQGKALQGKYKGKW